MALIAVDCDGVLLDYNRGFGKMWHAFFGGDPLPEVEPRAYHATTFYNVQAPAMDHAFWEHFDVHGWSDMPALPGAIEACQRLVDAGHTLVCVTSMPSHRGPVRLQNLQKLGFPIDQVIATGSASVPGANPKKEAIEKLKPDWFLDDELRKLKDLPDVNCVLIEPGHTDCPNQGQPREYLAMSVKTLAEFADRFLELNPPTPYARRPSLA